MTAGVDAVILCEDLQSQVFLYRALLLRGYNKRRIRLVPVPDGQGAGEQHVVLSYAEEVRVHRSRAARMNAALLVHIDADTLPCAARHARLAAALVQAELEPRGDREAIAILVPKRNIETWIHFFLSGKAVDESTAYPKFAEESEAWPAAEAFDQASKTTAPANAPPSLATALAEMGRVPA